MSDGERILDDATPGIGKARPYFYETPEEGELKACFMCVTCEDMFEWAGDAWECPACGYRLTSQAAVEVLDAHCGVLRRLRDFLQPPRRRWTTWLRELFSRRRRRALSENS